MSNQAKKEFLKSKHLMLILLTCYEKKKHRKNLETCKNIAVGASRVPNKCDQYQN